MLKRIILTAIAAVLTLMSFSVAAPAATAAVHTPSVVSASAIDNDYIDAIHEIMPSLQDSYTNPQLIKLGKLICKSLKYNSVASVDKTVTTYVTDEEAMVLVGLATAAYCERYWPKVSRYYGIS